MTCLTSPGDWFSLYPRRTEPWQIMFGFWSSEIFVMRPS